LAFTGQNMDTALFGLALLMAGCFLSFTSRKKMSA
jgi:LPXTG-motif cell wall-anchored protein